MVVNYCIMDWNYVSGFFDADGSISLVKKYSKGNANKTIQISFHNTELTILEEIRDFISSEIGVIGRISVKKPKKDNHSVSYDLKYVQHRGYVVSTYINSRHPKKIERIKIYKQIQELTPRNGKYTEEMLNQRNILVENFFIK